MRDGCRTMMLRAGITPRIITDNTPVVSTIIDTDGWAWVKAVIVLGALDDADMTAVVLLEESADPAMAGATAVADSDMVSQTEGVAPEVAAGFGFSHDNKIRKLEILPRLRYRLLTITPSGNAGNAFLSMGWHLGAPMHGTVVQLAA